MEATRRALRVATACTVAMLMFGMTLLLLTPGLKDSFGAHRGHGVGVSYTFDSYRCVGGNSQFRNCEWLGTVNIPENSFTVGVVQKNVVYRDNAPANVREGLIVEALWTAKDPESAYALSASNAWLNTLASAIAAGLLFLLFLFLTIMWWRKYSVSRAEQPKPGASERPTSHQPEREPAS
ncbi:MAG: hypothetical protein ACOYD0_05555 [Candidatus Nanopelagicales bacterium]